MLEIQGVFIDQLIKGPIGNKFLAAPSANSGTITEIIRTDDGTFYAAISGEGVYKSTSGSVGSFTQIADTLTLGSPLGRIVLNFTSSDNNIIYALYVGEALSCNGTMSDVHLRRWDNSSGASGAWTGNYDGAISLCTNAQLQLDPQEGYNLCVGVRPNNVNEIFIGGERLYRFTISGASTGTYVFAGGDQGNPTATNIHVDHTSPTSLVAEIYTFISCHYDVFCMFLHDILIDSSIFHWFPVDCKKIHLYSRKKNTLSVF